MSGTARCFGLAATQRMVLPRSAGACFPDHARRKRAGLRGIGLAARQSVAQQRDRFAASHCDLARPVDADDHEFLDSQGRIRKQRQRDLRRRHGNFDRLLAGDSGIVLRTDPDGKRETQLVGPAVFGGGTAHPLHQLPDLVERTRRQFKDIGIARRP